MRWIRTTDRLPDEKCLVETKIDDELGLRNQQKLRLHNCLFYSRDYQMHVYYTPTHWSYT